MASRPPLPVEDQTDEDFFDKLVDDDFPGTGPSTGDAEGDDSDDAKAFANLSLGEVGSREDDSGVQITEIEVNAAVIGDSVGHYTEESDSSGLSSTSGPDSMTESKNGTSITSTDGVSDSTANQSSGSSSSGVKEVQWSAFHADAAENGPGGFGSYSDFFSELEPNIPSAAETVEVNSAPEPNIPSASAEPKNDLVINSLNHEQKQDDQGRVTGLADANMQESDSIEYWENLYPGWKLDPSTGQWYQVDGFGPSANGQNGALAGSDGNFGVSYLQNSFQSVAGSVSESGTTGNLSNLNQFSQVNNGYPEHMYFDPQYPGWYYNTIAQEWCSLDSYVPPVQQIVESKDQMNQNGFAPDGHYSHSHNHGHYGEGAQTNHLGSQGYVLPQQDNNWSGPFQNYELKSPNNWPKTVSEGQVLPHVSGSDHLDNPYVDQQKPLTTTGMVPSYEKTSQGISSFGPQSFITGGSFRKQHNEPQQSFSPQFSLPQQSFNQQLNQPQQNFNQQYNQPQQSYNQQFNQPQQSFSQQYNQPQQSFSQQYNQPQQSFSQHYNQHQQYNQSQRDQNKQMDFSKNYYVNHEAEKFSHQALQSENQLACASNVGRSSAGRPPHALATFGFGGKLIVMKNNSCKSTPYGDQEPAGGSISVLNLMEVVAEKADGATIGMGGSSYFRSLCQQSFPGPLVGGNVGGKELNKWIEERIANCESPGMDYREGEVLRLLLSLLKIACQHYGKLRSPFGSDGTSRESENPESAVAKLFASAKRQGGQPNAYGAGAHCLQNFPSEGQMRATAAEVQSLLVSGRTKEALQCAQEGQLWGPALILAVQLGDQFYVNTVKQMALCQLVAGSPLRTLCLLIAGQHADVFSTDAAVNNLFPVSSNVHHQSGQVGLNIMLDDWEENLAVITANRTKDDELVIIHLGDCLWKERSEIVAAHICYLVAEANFEPYSDSARLCLIGADHWKFPRTFASPEAIQRTELYEYSKVLGNSQFSLLPFQPYKLLYAHMLAEVGRVSDALKYCQAISKSIKTGRAPEVETWKQLVSSLEERLKTHQQGGFTTNLAPAKLVGKLLNLFDSTAHRVVGGLPPVPPSSHSSAQDNGHYHQMMGPRVSASQSTMAMSSLVPSDSVEPMGEWTAEGSRKPRHNRSVSEPDFGRTPRQGDSSKEAAAGAQKNKDSAAGGSSRFVRFGFGSQFLQKTVGLVLKSKDRQAKLGEKNKFYYDEKLKRWVEEGAEPPAEEAALPPPPTTSAFQNGSSDYTLRKVLKNDSSPTNRSPESSKPSPLDFNSGIPPIPPSSNQFSARGRTGVRSRYVDTFNQGSGTPANLFQSPSVPSTKAAAGANPKFFVPGPASSPVETVDAISENVQECAAISENPSTSSAVDSFHSPAASPSISMQRFPSMGNIPKQGASARGVDALSAHSRRTASWSGSLPDAFSPPPTTELRPLGEALGMPPSTFMPNDRSLTKKHMPISGSNLGDDLHEVEL